MAEKSFDDFMTHRNFSIFILVLFAGNVFLNILFCGHVLLLCAEIMVFSVVQSVLLVYFAFSTLITQMATCQRLSELCNFVLDFAVVES